MENIMKQYRNLNRWHCYASQVGSNLASLFNMSCRCHFMSDFVLTEQFGQFFGQLHIAFKQHLLITLPE